MDKEIKKILKLEEERQSKNIELIASENYASKAVRDLQGSIFTNKYAEGYSGARYYGGCEYIDMIEDLAIKYACELFNVQFANVQPHSGSSANMAVYRALLNHGDKVMGLGLSDGGHLTHGYKLNFSGVDYEIVSYKVNTETETLDYGEIEELALKEKPKMIIAGASAYPRKIDFKRIREIADKTNSIFMVDMAHIAGLVAAGLHENPCLYADVVTSTTHKTLRGPRGGLILTNDPEIAKKINKVIFPGIQGGPLMHVIAAKCQCFYEALKPEFKEYQMQVLKNIKAMSDYFLEKNVKIISGGTDNHLILVDVYNTYGLSGKEAEEILDKVHITVNKNTIPDETLKATLASGIRIGSPAMTTRGFKEKEFKLVAEIINNVLNNPNDSKTLEKEEQRVLELTSKFPMI